MAAELAEHIKNGYKLVKVGFGKKGHANLGVNAARDIEFVKSVRAAIGPDVGFISVTPERLFRERRAAPPPKLPDA